LAVVSGERLLRVLVLADDYWHPAATAQAGLAPLTERGIAFDWITDAGDWSAERMADYSVVLFTKSNNVTASDRTPWMTPEAEEAFRAYVAAGGGLLVIHSGTAGYRETPTFGRLLGGIFVQHPPQCEVTIGPAGDQPLSAAVETFTIRDEHYHLAMGEEPVDIFLVTRSEHGEQPGGWTRREGVGRVCVLTPGHNVEVWLHPIYQGLIAAALHWCAPDNR
jgi:type 1 glutamine amidotransferase